MNLLIPFIFQNKNISQLLFNYYDQINIYLQNIFDNNYLDDNYFIIRGDEIPIFIPFE